MTIKEREYKKEMWGKGEWDNEPDRIDFEYAGYKCLMLRNMMGTWCGYVAVPEGHPLFGMDMFPLPDTDTSYVDSLLYDIDVHGGVTYTGSPNGSISVDTDKAVWMIGFDTGHHMDMSPMDLFRLLQDDHTRSLFGLTREDYGTYKNVEYVTSEVKKLAEQLSIMELEKK